MERYETISRVSVDDLITRLHKNLFCKTSEHGTGYIDGLNDVSRGVYALSGVKTDYDSGKVDAAKEIFELINKVYYGDEFLQMRYLLGSNGAVDYILREIANKYHLED